MIMTLFNTVCHITYDTTVNDNESNRRRHRGCRCSMAN